MRSLVIVTDFRPVADVRTSLPQQACPHKEYQDK